jgi:hypothetical protein
VRPSSPTKPCGNGLRQRVTRAMSTRRVVLPTLTAFCRHGCVIWRRWLRRTDRPCTADRSDAVGAHAPFRLHTVHSSNRGDVVVAFADRCGASVVTGRQRLAYRSSDRLWIWDRRTGRRSQVPMRCGRIGEPTCSGTTSRRPATRPHCDPRDEGVGTVRPHGASRARELYPSGATAACRRSVQAFRYGDVGQSEGVLNPAPFK